MKLREIRRSADDEKWRSRTIHQDSRIPGVRTHLAGHRSAEQQSAKKSTASPVGFIHRLNMSSGRSHPRVMSFRHYEYLVIKHGIYFLTVRPILGSPITRSLELGMEAIIAAIALCFAANEPNSAQTGVALESRQWRVVLDGVMGGLSSGKLTETPSGLQFTGELSLRQKQWWVCLGQNACSRSDLRSGGSIWTPTSRALKSKSWGWTHLGFHDRFLPPQNDGRRIPDPLRNSKGCSNHSPIPAFWV